MSLKQLSNILFDLQQRWFNQIDECQYDLSTVN